MLGGFPARDLDPAQTLYRVHRCERSAWWFSNDGSGRFDLLGGKSGTCYSAERPVGAFIEVFRRETHIPEAEVAARCLAELHAPASVQVADCTAPEARGFGVTAAIHSQPEYDLTREWAQAFVDAGFGGIRYLLSHDPSASEVGIALFGGTGEVPWQFETGPVPPEVIQEARRRFAVLVLPTPA